MPFWDTSRDLRDLNSMHAATRILLLTLLAAFAGCAPVNLRGEGFGDDTGRWVQKLRPETESGKMLGFDSRAREIEQNVGVR